MTAALKVPLTPAEEAALKSTVCVTGAGGYVASAVVQRLLAAGHTGSWGIFWFERNPEGHGVDWPSPWALQVWYCFGHSVEHTSTLNAMCQQLNYFEHTSTLNARASEIR